MSFEMPNGATLVVRGSAAVAVPPGFARVDADGEGRFAAASPGGAMLSVAPLDAEGPSPVRVLSALAQGGQAPGGHRWGPVHEGEVNGLPAAMSVSDEGEAGTRLVALYGLGGWYLVLAARCPAGDAALGRALMGAVESVRPLGSPAASRQDPGGPATP